MTRATPGEGLAGLNERAKAMAAEFGHHIPRIREYRGGYEGRCQNEGCIAMVRIRKDLVASDKIGFGGTAVTKPCFGMPGARIED